MAQFFQTLDFVELPQPLSRARLVSRDGRRLVLLDAGGRVWRVDVAPETRGAAVVPAPVTVDPARLSAWSASQDLSRLLIVTPEGPLRVVDLPSGRTVYEQAAPDAAPWRARAVCLTPDGRHLIGMGATDTRLLRLDGGGEADAPFQDWHVVTGGTPDAAPRPVPLDIGGVGALLAHPRPSDPAKRAPEPAPFYLFAACYGYVASRVVAVTAEGRPYRQAGGGLYQKRRTHEFRPHSLAYDPTLFTPPFGRRHALVRDQGGVGLAALDPETGAAWDFPRAGDAAVGYGYVRAALPCGTAPLAWVRTADDAVLWHLDGRKAPRETLWDSPQDVVALYPRGSLVFQRPPPRLGDFRLTDAQAQELATGRTRLGIVEHQHENS